jgi:hypothetical protein
MKVAIEIAVIDPIAPDAICIAVFMFRHHRDVRREMNSLAGAAVDKTLPPIPSDDGNGRLIAVRSTPLRLACKSTIMRLPAHSLRPEGEEKRLWVSSIKLRYRNARRLMFARAMSEHITGLEPHLQASRCEALHVLVGCR